MRLSCLQENLSPALSIVGRAVATRTTLPITQNVHISTDDSRLKLSATNLEIAISTWIGAQIEEEGSITVPARVFTELVSSFPQEKIDFETSVDPLSLSAQCARYEAQINGADPEDFPPIPQVETGILAKIDAKVLREAISKVVIAAATEDSRPVLTGIQVDLSGDKFTFAGADGFRLAVYKGELLDSVTEEMSFIVPARSLQEVGRLIGSNTEQVEFTVTPSKSQALFSLDNVEIVTQMVQGTFPNYNQLIPSSYDSRVVMDSADFSRATKTASIFARDGSGIIRVQVEAGSESNIGSVAVLSRAEEVGENQGEIDAEVEGTDAKIAFNSKYLLDVLDVLGGGKVALETTTPSSPGVLRSVGDDNYVHVVMPMFVQW
ncbi:MAG: DNA polymerase III subunit beta [Anaerolineales bacterium]|nr:DNA polymerase III subunit beta [Anaerolineales bacterium]|tara:strand:+ start:335 stop:1468 length:1134 start_codon:yes stop_codon:yes gene_type:complete